jgi:hypothetical protein
MKRAINVEERLREGESAERLIKRFFKKCKKQEIIKEHLEKTSFFRTRRQKRRIKALKNKYLKKFEKNK